MNFVNNIYAVLSNLGRNSDLFRKVANVLDRIVGSSIQFMNIEGPGLIERETGFTFITRLGFFC